MLVPFHVLIVILFVFPVETKSEMFLQFSPFVSQTFETRIALFVTLFQTNFKVKFPVLVRNLISFPSPSKTIQVVFWLVPDFKINLVRFSTQ